MSSYRWIPWAFAGALGVVVMVNGALAYFATSTSTGLVTEHPYTNGNEYNRVLDAAAASDALGWKARLAAPAGQKGALAVEITDRDGVPVAGLKVSVIVVRPVEPLPAVTLPMPQIRPGRYEAPLALSRPGQWEVRIAARRGADLFEYAERIVVK